jgi:xylose isomerase
LRKAVDDAGIVVAMMTTNLFTHPIFRESVLPKTTGELRRYALGKVMSNLDPAAELGAQIRF